MNLGNFNSAKLGATLEDTISNPEEFEQKFDFLYSKIRNKIALELGKLNSAFKKTVKEAQDEQNPET